MSLVDLDLIRKYSVNGPRYTSYPTALKFADYSPDEFRASIQGSRRQDGPLSLYFHIPFCSTLCYYCACSKIVTRDKAKGARYLDYLFKEMSLLAPLVAGREIRQVHLGGGTPTFLSDDQLDTLMDAARRLFQFGPEVECGIEIDPRTVDVERIHRLRRAGFNRLSMGIQDFEPAVQAAVNRKQGFEETRCVIQAARDVGFDSISVDLIYGLPHQTLATIGNTLRSVIELSPDRISIYNYAHLPDRFPPQKRINVVDLPDAESRLRILKQCIDVLGMAGYRYIGMDHFAKPDDALSIAMDNGTLQRNFQGYSTHAECDMIAMGITGISQVGDSYAQNVKTLEEYEAALDAGELPIAKGLDMTEEDRVRKAVIQALVCRLELRFAEIEQAFGIDFHKHFVVELMALAGLAADGLVQVEPDRIVVTERGRLLIRNVCMVFDEYFRPASTTAYSKAI
ncbi:MAG: oxygen-independent coproporphyrinogen III oxidase [Pseudomonadales bacterium]|nr:oxygen-independent coproporphyrinogen III oxidase [Pseudomonadales bacterium]